MCLCAVASLCSFHFAHVCTNTASFVRAVGMVWWSAHFSGSQCSLNSSVYLAARHVSERRMLSAPCLRPIMQ